MLNIYTLIKFFKLNSKRNCTYVEDVFKIWRKKKLHKFFLFLPKTLLNQFKATSKYLLPNVQEDIKFISKEFFIIQNKNKKKIKQK